MSRKDFYVWVEIRKRKNKPDKYYIRIEDEAGERSTHDKIFDNLEAAKKEAEKLKIEIKEKRKRSLDMTSETMLTEEIKLKINEWRNKEGNLIMIFHAIQDYYGYVPRKVAIEVSEMLQVKLARIYELLTFYHYFKLNPPGKYIVSVCMGTACYLKGAPELVDELKELLDIEEGGTTKDGMFQLELVRCIGCCGVAPAISINGEVYCNVKKTELAEILNNLRIQSVQK
jgi:NADH-quinone oxidoreductase subunit E